MLRFQILPFYRNKHTILVEIIRAKPLKAINYLLTKTRILF